jgi:hypothetical protein
MVDPLAGGEQPYPEPVNPPAAPPEAAPLYAPQEEPSPAPFDDGGRPTDANVQQPYGDKRRLIPVFKE